MKDLTEEMESSLFLKSKKCVVFTWLNYLKGIDADSEMWIYLARFRELPSSASFQQKGCMSLI